MTPRWDGPAATPPVTRRDDPFGDAKNVIKGAVTPDHRDYAAVMGAPMAPVMAPGVAAALPPAAQQPVYQPAPASPPISPQAPAGYPHQPPQRAPTPQPAAPAQSGGFAKPKWAQ